MYVVMGSVGPSPKVYNLDSLLAIFFSVFASFLKYFSLILIQHLLKIYSGTVCQAVCWMLERIKSESDTVPILRSNLVLVGLFYSHIGLLMVAMRGESRFVGRSMKLNRFQGQVRSHRSWNPEGDCGPAIVPGTSVDNQCSCSNVGARWFPSSSSRWASFIHSPVQIPENTFLT